MMQKRKNIKLVIVLTVLVVMTAATYILLQDTEQAVVQNADLFAVQDVSEIDSVVLSEEQQTKTLHYENNDWLVNDRYAADPQKLTILFAILNQVKAKRPVATAQQQQVDSLFEASGTTVTFYRENDIVRQFQVAGAPQAGITYFRNEEGTYIVNIPGYRSYLAAIFNMSLSDWRNKLIFDEVSWNNLEKVDVEFPASEELSGFEIIPKGRYYTIEGIAATDSVRLLDYLDRVSLLTASEYLEQEARNADSLKAAESLINISITDIRNRPFQLKIFPAPGEQDHLALKDSMQWLKIPQEQLDPLMKSRSFFVRE